MQCAILLSFGESTRDFSFIFSIETVLTAVQQLLAFTGFTVLYKVHIYGPSQVLLRFSPLLLNISFSLLLFLAYNFVLLMSSSILYIYGLQKFREFEEQQVQKRHITWTEESRRLWGYIPHLSALLTLLLAISISAPLMYDFTLVYCGSLDGAVLSGVISTVMHLLFWVLLWLGLSVKQSWRFKSFKDVIYPFDCGKSKTFNGSELELLNDKMELPLLVIENGQTYHITEKRPKDAIIDIVQTCMMHKSSLNDYEDIYWLKSNFSFSKCVDKPVRCVRKSKCNVQQKSSFSKQQKITFEDRLVRAPVKRMRSFNSKSSDSIGKTRKPHVKFENDFVITSYSGNYTTLQETVSDRDNGSQIPALKLQSCPLLRFTNQYNVNARPLLDEGDYSLLFDNRRISNRILTPVVVHSGFQATPGDFTPRSTLSTDSGITKSQGYEGDFQNNLTESISESSTSDKTDSDSPSGVPSNCIKIENRSYSLENVSAMKPSKFSWKTFSLQDHASPTTRNDLIDNSMLSVSVLCLTRLAMPGHEACSKVHLN